MHAGGVQEDQGHQNDYRHGIILLHYLFVRLWLERVFMVYVHRSSPPKRVDVRYGIYSHLYAGCAGNKEGEL